MIDVKYPDKNKKENSILTIHKQTKLTRKNALLFLIDAYKEIGIKVIFKNSIFTYLLAIIIYTFLLALLLITFKNAYSDKKVFADVLSVFFFASPFVTQLSELLYFIYEAPSGVLEYRNSYKYTAYQMSLLKMPLFSIATMLINCIIAVVWCSLNGISNILTPLGLIACSVFIYSLFNVTFFIHFKYVGFIFSVILWLIINYILLSLNTKIKITLFITVPFTLHVIVVTILISVFIKIIEKSYFKPACLITE